jgi:hypothetical protein
MSSGVERGSEREGCPDADAGRAQGAHPAALAGEGWWSLDAGRAMAAAGNRGGEAVTRGGRSFVDSASHSESPWRKLVNNWHFNAIPTPFKAMARVRCELRVPK